MLVPSDFPNRSFEIHRSAIIAGLCYLVGATVDEIEVPDMLQILNGDLVMLASLLIFICLVAGIQIYMGTSLSSSVTSTPKRLCVSGPFRYSRNPIYLAFVVPLAALGFYSVVAAIVSIAIYVTATTRYVIRDEERQLQNAFGAEYDAYCRSTPRWLIV